MKNTSHVHFDGTADSKTKCSNKESSESDNDSSFFKDARPLLPKAAFFMGDLRDGLPMLNMQAAYLILSKNCTEKQVGALFLAFGLSQFLCMTPAGYVLDYTSRKINIVTGVSIAVATLTIIGTITAQDEGKNMHWLMLCRILQGGLTSILPPGFNGITLGIVGTKGFTHQVSRNRVMTHVGTASVVAFGGAIAYVIYPNIEALFLVSPLAAIGAWYYLSQIVPTHVDRDAARSLILESPTMTEYELADDVALCKQQAVMLPREAEQTTINWSSPSPANNVNELTTDYVILEYHAINSNSRIRTPPRPTPRRAVAPIMLGSGGDTQTRSSSPITTTLAISPAINGAGNNGFVRNALKLPSSTLEQSLNTRPPLPQQQSEQRGGKSSSKGISARRSFSSIPSLNVGWGDTTSPSRQKHDDDDVDNVDDIEDSSDDLPPPRARTPLAVLLNPTLILFTIITFFFNLANSSVLPLVMQSLSVGDARFSMLLSSLCIVIAQGCMAYFAKFCGDYSPYWGRKKLMLAGLISLSIRCFLLTGLVSVQNTILRVSDNDIVPWWLKSLILSTQFLDSLGAGIVGTLQVLVTADISGGTGRFSLMMGVTSAAMCLGATVSGYLGPYLAFEYGYPFAFSTLGVLSLIPFLSYLLIMPETMPQQAFVDHSRTRRLVDLQNVLGRLKESTHRRWKKSRQRLSNLLAAISKSEDNESRNNHSVFPVCPGKDVELD
ncbi:hypothetical protein ACA910_007914 [Epithemia clementina (nom. ined.)]